jgi:hypothetical protein
MKLLSSIGLAVLLGSSVASGEQPAREKMLTQSGREVGHAILPLLLLNYDFPDGFPKHAPNYEGGGLRDYVDAIRNERTDKPAAGDGK